MEYSQNWQYLAQAPESPLTQIPHPVCRQRGVTLWLKRDDQLFLGDERGFCGNKWRKLKYNLLAARDQGYTQLLSFGGAFSNHLVATAAAGRLFGFRTVGVIRGEAAAARNPSLSYASACGMQLHFTDRATYRQKTTSGMLAALQAQYGEFYLLPEGGTNLRALKGCRELGERLTAQCPMGLDYVALACGTGGTMAGVIQGLPPGVKVLGFSALKGDFLQQEIAGWLSEGAAGTRGGWSVETDYHFGGFAKFTSGLMDFIRYFQESFGIQLEPIYTGKMMYGLLAKIEEGYFASGSRIVAIHTGGLQGLQGFNERFGHLIG